MSDSVRAGACDSWRTGNRMISRIFTLDIVSIFTLMLKGYRTIPCMLSIRSVSSCNNAWTYGRTASSILAITSRDLRFNLQRCDEHGAKGFATQATRWGGIMTNDLPSPRRVPIDLGVQEAQQQWEAQLPALCPGCGAPGQNVDKDAPGYYDLSRGRMVGKSGNRASKAKKQQQDEIVRRVIGAEMSSEVNKQTDVAAQMPESVQVVSASTPYCERCHDLRYQSRGTSIIHPSMKSIQAIIEESPHSRNHIYHVLDAADFPMSLIPNLQHTLKLPRMRTQNRRAKHRNFIGGRTAEVSFIITRSDLLAPKKEQVDTLMPYLTEVLRDALGRQDKKWRLGNVRCVSAKRGWWTKTVKEEIYDRGGAGWMVGKVNVGKSALFEVVFPKGRNQDEDVNPDRWRQRLKQAGKAEDPEPSRLGRDSVANGNEDIEESEVDSAYFADSPGELGEVDTSSGPADEQFRLSDAPTATASDAAEDTHALLQATELRETHSLGDEQEREAEEDADAFEDDDDTSLLPSAQKETAFPEMPLVSSLPGTTASPIRIPFGKGKGELIDLPGVNRTTLDEFVQDEFKKDMVMKSRIVPDQHTIKPTQSLLLGGLIRVTPRMDEECVLLAYPFVPTAFTPHLTGTHKAVAVQTGIHSPLSHKFVPVGEEYRGNISSIATPDAKTRIKSAGVFPLKWDVTKRRTGSLTDKSAGKRMTADLPFTVYSADILIESVGWVEIVCQMRKFRAPGSAAGASRQQATGPVEDALSALGSSSAADRGQRSSSEFPEVEVFTPEGKFVAARRPMNASLLGGKKPIAVHKRRERPRQTISKQKRREGSLR